MEESIREEISAKAKDAYDQLALEDQDPVVPKQKWVEPTLTAYNSSEDIQNTASSASSAY